MGGRLDKFKVSYDCASHQSKLLALGVPIDSDEKDVHPLRFCHSCYNICTRAVKATTLGKDYTPKLAKFQWTQHTDDNCSVCEQLGKSQRGRKPKKPATGRPSDQLVELITAIKERSPPSVLDFKMRERLSHGESAKDLICPLCQLVLDRPLLLTTCNNLVCMACCVSHLYQHTDLCCPICCPAQHTLDISTIIPAPPVIQKLLSSMETTCGMCQQSVTAGK